MAVREASSSASILEANGQLIINIFNQAVCGARDCFRYLGITAFHDQGEKDCRLAERQLAIFLHHLTISLQLPVSIGVRGEMNRYLGEIFRYKPWLLGPEVLESFCTLCATVRAFPLALEGLLQVVVRCSEEVSQARQKGRKPFQLAPNLLCRAAEEAEDFISRAEAQPVRCAYYLSIIERWRGHSDESVRRVIAKAQRGGRSH